MASQVLPPPPPNGALSPHGGRTRNISISMTDASPPRHKGHKRDVSMADTATTEVEGKGEDVVSTAPRTDQTIDDSGPASSSTTTAEPSRAGSPVKPFPQVRLMHSPYRDAHAESDDDDDQDDSEEEIVESDEDYFYTLSEQEEIDAERRAMGEESDEDSWGSEEEDEDGYRDEEEDEEKEDIGEGIRTRVSLKPNDKGKATEKEGYGPEEEGESPRKRVRMEEEFEKMQVGAKNETPVN